MKNLLFLTLILGGIAAGCASDRTTGPGAHEASWDLVRFHQPADGADVSYRDITIRPDGELTLVDDRGDGASSSGLLAGMKLETLARLIDALPPQSYAPPVSCTPDGFFVSVTHEGEVRTYATGSCDPAAPPALTDLRQMAVTLEAEIYEPRVQAIPYQVLSQGTDSAIGVPRREVLRDRDALAQLIREHRPNQPVAIPRVDFARQVVVAEFQGECPTTGYQVAVEGVERTDSGWLRVVFQQTAPSTRCPVGPVPTRPFVLIAMDRGGEDLLFETTRTVTQCEP